MLELDKITINFDAKSLWLLNIALAVVMFGVALGITTKDFRLLLKEPKLLVAGVLSQFIVLPFITFLLVLILKPQPSIALGLFMVAACPGGNISNFMTHLAKGNTALSVSLTAFATVLAVFLTPINFELYASLYQPTASLLQEVNISFFELLKLVILLLGIPLVVGMFVRYRNEAIAIKLSKILKPLSIIVFIAIVCIAFYKNIDVFIGYVKYVVGIGIFHNALALFLGFLIARLFRLSLKNQKTIMIETGIQNSGLGLLLIFTFFDGLGGMALIAAFWGIWHIISGLVLSLYWSRKNN